MGIVAISWRKVDAELQAVFVGGVGCHPNEVAFPVLPGTCGNAVFRVLGGPETKAIVVLGYEHDVSCARIFRGSYPLVRIGVGRVENFGIGSSIAPFAIEESVGAEMDDDAKFEILPGDLLRRGLDIDGVDGLRVHAC